MGKSPVVQSEEHILGSAFLEEFGLTECLVQHNLHKASSGECEILKGRKAKHFTQTGACRRCNGSWMKDRDDAARIVIRDLFNHKKNPGTLVEEDRKRLASWVLKTATAQGLRKFESPGMPESHFADAMADKWPNGAAGFISYLPHGKMRAGTSLIAQFQQHGKSLIINNGIPLQGYTFMACYGDVGIGVSFSTPRFSSIVIQKDIHHIFMKSEADAYEALDFRRIIVPNGPLQPMASSVNTVTMSVGISFEPLIEIQNAAPAFFRSPQITSEENDAWRKHLIRLKNFGSSFGSLGPAELDNLYAEQEKAGLWSVTELDNPARPQSYRLLK